MSESDDRVLEHLASLDVDYEVVDCDPNLAYTAEFCATYGFGLDVSANAIVVVGKAWRSAGSHHSASQKSFRCGLMSGHGLRAGDHRGRHPRPQASHRPYRTHVAVQI